jgi:hypothetical protein
MKKLLFLLLMIPTLSFARTAQDIEITIMNEWNDYMDQHAKGSYKSCEIKLAKVSNSWIGSTNEYKATLFVVKGKRDYPESCKTNKLYPFSLDVWDGKDLVWRVLDNAYQVK